MPAGRKSRRDGIAAKTFIDDVNPGTAPEEFKCMGDYGMSGLMHCGVEHLATLLGPTGASIKQRRIGVLEAQRDDDKATWLELAATSGRICLAQSASCRSWVEFGSPGSPKVPSTGIAGRTGNELR